MTKEEKAAYMRQYYQENPEAREKKRAVDREYYLRNKEKLLAYQTEYYNGNREKVLKRVSVNGRLRRNTRRAEAIAKLGGKCLDCEETNPVVLQFHHRPGEVKLYEVTQLASSPKKFWAEVEKCDLLCANHHLIRQAEGR